MDYTPKEKDMTAESAVDIEPGLQPVNTAQTVQIGYDNDLAAIPTTQRGLKSRHAQMIALGGTIGTGLFVGSGQALLIGGPLFFVLGYCIITILVYGIVSCHDPQDSLQVTDLFLSPGHRNNGNELLPSSRGIFNGILRQPILLSQHWGRTWLALLLCVRNLGTRRDYRSQYRGGVLAP